MAVLSKRWNTRLIVIPGAPLVRRGPYRWSHHPNYTAVTAEVAFSIANALVLNVRIRRRTPHWATPEPITDADPGHRISSGD
jgi:methyltransferase